PFSTLLYGCVLIRSLQNDSPFFWQEKFPGAYHRLRLSRSLFYDLSDTLGPFATFEKKLSAVESSR
ncbi:MAG TPA: hypothetical protein VMF91_10525, partial [Bryobacteraceae bacterium]|nr:hypothetical protein [Bryobacteraceae bacterium]